MKIVHVVKVFLQRESDGKILVQTRADTKKVTPGRFEYSAGGLIDPGESPHEAILREMREEIGVQTPVEFFDALDVFNPYIDAHNVFYLFFGTIKQDITWFDTHEVKAVGFYSLTEIDDMIKTQGEDKFDLGYIEALAKLKKFLGGRDKL